jgi:hypothetical protein
MPASRWRCRDAQCPVQLTELSASSKPPFIVGELADNAPTMLGQTVVGVPQTVRRQGIGTAVWRRQAMQEGARQVGRVIRGRISYRALQHGRSTPVL